MLLLLLVLHAVTGRYPASLTVPYLNVLLLSVMAVGCMSMPQWHPVYRHMLLLPSTLPPPSLLPCQHQPLSLPCLLHPMRLLPHVPPRCKWGWRLLLVVPCWMVAVGGVAVLRVPNLNMSLVAVTVAVLMSVR